RLRRWASKVYPTDDKPTEFKELGQVMESVVLDWAERGLGKLQRGRRVTLGRLAVNLDGETADAIPVEGKTSGLTGPVYGEWGEAGTDQVPIWVTPQVHAQMMATGADHAYVAALLGGRGFVLYRIPRSHALCNHICVVVDEFWEKYVKTKTPPPDTETTSLAVLESIRREPKSTTAIEAVPRAEWQTADIVELANKICERGDIVEHYQKASKVVNFADKLRKAVRAHVLTLMGDAEQLLLPDGRKVTYMPQSRTGIDKDA
ncbi:unnamed protein product, partial [marine sediment metagenome]